MDEFSLYELEEERLNTILNMTEDAKTLYIHNLIQKFYPKINPEDNDYVVLQQAYRSSFVLEKIYRNNNEIREGFTPVYTKTGLIRDLTNELYFTDDHLYSH